MNAVDRVDRFIDDLGDVTATWIRIAERIDRAANDEGDSRDPVSRSVATSLRATARIYRECADDVIRAMKGPA